MQNDFNTPTQAALDMEREIEARQFWRRYLATKNAPKLLLCKNASGTITLCADAPGEVQLVSILMCCGAY